MGRRGGLRRAGASRAHVEKVGVLFLQGGTFPRSPLQRTALPAHPIRVLENLTVPKEPCTGTTVPWRAGRSSPCPWHSLPQHTDRALWTDTQQAVGGEGTGEALSARRAKHPRDKPLPISPLPVRDLSATGSALVLVWFGLVLRCAQDRLCSFLSSGGRTCPPALLSLPCAHPPAGLSRCWSAQSQWDRHWDG